METTLLLNRETYNNKEYDDEVIVFAEWLTSHDYEWDDALGVTWVTAETDFDRLITFQLLVREARKDE